MPSKADLFFGTGTNVTSQPTTKRKVKILPPKYITERQDTQLVHGPWISCDLYASDIRQANRHLQIVSESRLQSFRKCRFRVKRIKDGQIIREAKHVSQM